MQKYIETNRNINNTLRTKEKPFSTAFRIPFIINGPDNKTPGLKCDALVSSVDLTPTILDLSELKYQNTCTGKSMSDWYRKGTGPKQPYIYLGLNIGKKCLTCSVRWKIFTFSVGLQYVLGPLKRPV